MTVRALRSTAHRILERCDRATVESLRITEAGHQAGPLPTPRQGIGPAFLSGERGRHQVLEGRAGEQVVQGPSSHSRSRASRWTGIAEPANASSAVSIARPGSEAKTAATPSLRRRRPSARANVRPCLGSCPSNQPVATPAWMSVVVEWGSKTIATATATSTTATHSPRAAGRWPQPRPGGAASSGHSCWLAAAVTASSGPRLLADPAVPVRPFWTFEHEVTRVGHRRSRVRCRDWTPVEALERPTCRSGRHALV
jgi:hypothetical protein